MHLNTAIGSLHTATKERPVLTQTHSLLLLRRCPWTLPIDIVFILDLRQKIKFTVTSAPLAKQEILQFLMDYKSG